MAEQQRFLNTKETLKILDVCVSTLRTYDRKGLITTIRTPGGKRLYDVQKFLKKSDIAKTRKNVCYCRVSSQLEKNVLDQHITLLKQKYPDYEIIYDTEPSINFKRTGLLKIIDYAVKKELDNLILIHKDHLSQFSYDLIEHILITLSNTQITLIDTTESNEKKIINNMIQTIAVFSSNIHELNYHKTFLENEINIIQKPTINIVESDVISEEETPYKQIEELNQIKPIIKKRGRPSKKMN